MVDWPCQGGMPLGWYRTTGTQIPQARPPASRSYTSSGYSRRSLVENAVFRYKSILGQRMRSRSLDGQRVEVRLACKILNTMTGPGRPDSVKVG